MPATATTARATASKAAGKRERNKAENRDAILAAARRVFADLGYERATIRDVIGATDLAAGTFYNYFPDKKSVLFALIDGTMSRMLARWQVARRGARTVEDIVRRSLHLSFAMVAEDKELFLLLQRNAGAMRNVLAEPGFLANRAALRADLQRVLRQPGAPDLDVDYLTAAITGLAVETAACAVDRGPGSMEAAADFATSMVLHGISAFAPKNTRPSPPAVPSNQRKHP